MSSWRYRFTPTLLPTLAALALVPVFIGLGLWQLGRADYKQALQDEYDARTREEPVVLSGERLDPEWLRFRRVVIRGEYDLDHQILLDNRVHQGQAGYHVLTPLRIKGSSVRVLVNRGWVPVGADRQRLPATPAPGGRQDVVGVVTIPHAEHFSLGEAETRPGAWQRVWQYLDLDKYAKMVQFPVADFVVLMEPGVEGGFVREWARLDTGIATHKGYAFQWFSLAVAVVVVYVLVNLQKQPARSESS